MKVGDLVRWKMAPGNAYYNDSELYGIVITRREDSFDVLWSDGLQGVFELSSEPKWQMDVISEAR